MTDVVFFLKSFPDTRVKALGWGSNVKLIGVDPPASLMCGGSDPRCSTAYSNLWNWLKGADGRVLPNFLAHFAPGISVGRVAFVGFSAAHGFLNPLANNDADRADIDAYVLLDSSFGGGKTGYVKFVEDAARGERLFVTTTSNTGGDDSFKDVWAKAQQELEENAKQVSARAPMPEPSGGTWKLGDLAFYLRYVDAKNGSELPHWEMNKVLPAVLDAYLISYWNGRLGGIPWGLVGGVALAAGGAYAALRILRS